LVTHSHFSGRHPHGHLHRPPRGRGPRRPPWRKSPAFGRLTPRRHPSWASPSCRRSSGPSPRGARIGPGDFRRSTVRTLVDLQHRERTAVEQPEWRANGGEQDRRSGDLIEFGRLARGGLPCAPRHLRTRSCGRCAGNNTSLEHRSGPERCCADDLLPAWHRPELASLGRLLSPKSRANDRQIWLYTLSPEVRGTLAPPPSSRSAYSGPWHHVLAGDPVVVSLQDLDGDLDMTTGHCPLAAVMRPT
jgi:hypothetical protein